MNWQNMSGWISALVAMCSLLYMVRRERKKEEFGVMSKMIRQDAAIVAIGVRMTQVEQDIDELHEQLPGIRQELVTKVAEQIEKSFEKVLNGRRPK